MFWADAKLLFFKRIYIVHSRTWTSFAGFTLDLDPGWLRPPLPQNAAVETIDHTDAHDMGNQVLLPR